MYNKPEKEILLKNFINQNLTPNKKISLTKCYDYRSVCNHKLPWLKVNLEVPIPHKEMLKEALHLKDFFVLHRGSDSHLWKGLTLYGISHAHTDLLSDYGIPDTEENEQKYLNYTDICRKLCPVTYEFLHNSMNYDEYTRVRFMLIEPGGFIMPHKDQEEYFFGSLNLVLSHHTNTKFVVEDYGEIELSPGDLFLFANGYKHAVFNNSDEPRVHILLHGTRNKQFWRKRIINCFNDLIDNS